MVRSASISFADQPRVDVGGVPFVATSMANAVDDVLGAAEQREPVAIRLANAYCVSLTDSNSDYKSLLSGHGVNLPDGVPVALAMRAKLLGRRRAELVRGPSLFTDCLKQSAAEGDVRHFFLGTTESTIEKMLARVEAECPGLQVAGSYAPPFGDILDDAQVKSMADRVVLSECDIVWVAVGTPKQDFLASRLAEATGRPCVGVGAAFDFYAGSVREAPGWLQKSGFEWVFRFASDPRRLWRRYVFGNMTFLRLVFQAHK